MTAPPAESRELRTMVLRLAGAVLVLHVTGIALHAALGIEHRGSTTRYLFGGVWVALTLFIVLRGLARVRELRLRRRAALRRTSAERNQDHP